jgi:hypothetical protein
MPDQTTRIAITLSAYEHRLLTLWGKLHNKPASTFAGQIVGARIEANAELIRREIAEHAKSEGINPTELEARWLGSNDE